MQVALVSLVLGLILGYLAQRSRICFIGGLRDFVLVRDTDLLKGAVAFFITAWLAFSVAGALHLVDLRPPVYSGTSPLPAQTLAGQQSILPTPANSPGAIPRTSVTAMVVAVAAGLILGLFSTLANGCPTRQIVLAAQGLRDSRFYLSGFFIGVIVYNLVTKPLLARIF
jgi:uncharacterized protein